MHESHASHVRWAAAHSHYYTLGIPQLLERGCREFRYQIAQIDSKMPTMKFDLWQLLYAAGFRYRNAQTKEEVFFLVAWIRLRAIHATYGKLFWLSLYVYRGRGGSVISARFILARTTTDKSNGRSGRRGKRRRIGGRGMFHFASLFDDAQIRDRRWRWMQWLSVNMSKDNKSILSTIRVVNFVSFRKWRVKWYILGILGCFTSL